MNRHKCSTTSHLQIVPAGTAEYCQLSQYHYRHGRLGPYKAMYALVDTHPVRSRFSEGRIIVGVIVYSMPSPNLALRNVATDGVFAQFGDRKAQLQLVNENIRCISRVIIDPRYRGLSLASYLVRETLVKLDIPVIEALAVMGQVNPFFEKAGMKKFEAKTSLHCAKLSEALGMIGIDKTHFTDPRGVYEKIKGLSYGRKHFIEKQFCDFLQAYGKRRNMVEGIERTSYALGKLSSRPAYYIWRNPRIELTIKRSPHNADTK
jgi:hypothetical protein